MSLSLTTLSPSEMIITGPESLLQWRQRHQLPVPGAEFSPQYRNHVWDGTWTPGKYCHQRGEVFEMKCSRGLVPRVIQDIMEVDYDFNVVSKEDVAQFCAKTKGVDQLRDYQVRALVGALLAGWSRIAYATNAGKGAVIALMARFCVERGKRVLICCDERAVFDALQGEIEKWGRLDPDLIKAGEKNIPTSPITLAMIPTLARRVKAESPAKVKQKPWTEWLAGVDMMLVDEADKADAATWRAVFGAAKNTTWRTGFSGSFPDELLYDLKFDELMGPIIDRVTNAEMVERGVSAKPTIEVHAYDGTASLPQLPEGWWLIPAPELRTMVFDSAIGTNQHRHNFIRSLISPDTPTVIVVNRIAHGQALTLSIPGAVFLDGSTSDDERVAALEEFRLGKIFILVVTKILDRGSNRLGHTADLIFASGEGSATQILQRMGRGLRREDGKENLRLVDIIDRIALNNGPSKRVKVAAGFLHSAARRRLEVYAKQGFDIVLKAAPSCSD